jgi:hypothetical protein
MPYFPDLSKYSYAPFTNISLGNLTNVGWLDLLKPYPKGKIDEQLLDKIFFLCSSPVNKTRGWHRCPFCGEFPVIVRRNEKELVLGDAEIRLQGEGGVQFAAPTLIYHYIQAHEYLPPDVFLSALKEL